ncbi:MULTISPECIES: ABC transporter permease [Caldilinea]|nr:MULTISPECIES: ABC transporter permease [Caldilinea]MBO9393225.1 ABC transporter permease [Caldilinea sp.]
MAFYLAFKEVWRNKGRFALIAAVVALITVLVLFIAALAEGLASANREYIEKLNGELLVFQANTQLSTAASRIGRSRVGELRRVEGVEAVGQVGFSTAKLVSPNGGDDINVAFIGVEPGMPGEPEVFAGRQLERSRGNSVIVDEGVIARLGVQVGDLIRLKITRGTKEEFYDLTVVGLTDRRQYFFQPAVFAPIVTWDNIRADGGQSGGELISNIAVVKLRDPGDIEQMKRRIEAEVKEVEVADKKTAWEALPGYAAQQSTLSTQQFFTFFIGVLVVGGFFQIQTLQKVAQIGMLKAIGLSNWTVGLTAFAQIIMVNALGVAIGAAITLALTANFPVTVPIVLTGFTALAAVLALLAIGPIGGIVSVVALLRIEPLRALGMA